MARAKRVSLMYVLHREGAFDSFRWGGCSSGRIRHAFQESFFPAPRENPPRKTLHGRHKPVHLI